MAIHVLLADDHGVLRQSLRALLEREGLIVVGEASDGRGAVELVAELRPQVAVIDLSMPLLNGIDAARAIQKANQKANPQTRIVLLTVHTEDSYVLEAFRAGVRGYVVKTQAATDLVHAIHDVADGGTYLSPRISRAVIDAFVTGTELPPEPLTLREREVLVLVAEGKATKEIAELLGVSVKTVETHRAHIMNKLGIHEAANLVRYAIRRGLIEP
ncbi:MAG TPA: response regulator transcription factor [Kofleriaceae bacterium]